MEGDDFKQIHCLQGGKRKWQNWKLYSGVLILMEMGKYVKENGGLLFIYIFLA